MSTLSDLLRKHMPAGKSARWVSRQAEDKGHALSPATATAYLGDRHGTPTEPVLAAFSEVLTIPIDRLREAAGQPKGERTPYIPPAEADRLSQRQRLALNELIRSFVATEEAPGEQEPQQSTGVTPISRAGSGSRRRQGAPTKHPRDSGLSDSADTHGLEPAAAPARPGERRGIDVEYENGV